jgi:transposase
MCLKAQPPWPMPADTAAVGAALLKEDSPYRLTGDKLFGHLCDTDFADLYSSEGKPGISPVILAFVTVFQFLEKLPDRQAAEALRMRLDWKYALHLPLTYAGFDYSVLSEFRDRLLAHGAEGRVFDHLVSEFRAWGLITERGRQRTDSIAMLTKVRRLSRLELVVETLRVVVGTMLKADRAWSERILPPSWEAQYGERFVMQRHPREEWATYDQQVGSDGQWLLERLVAADVPAIIQALPEVQVLKTVWMQQFQETGEKVVYQAGITYDGYAQIQTPHDPDARYSKKRVQEWVGGKVQVTETDDEDQPHLITDIAATCSSHTDYTALPEIQTRLQERQCLPAKQYADSGYVSGPNLASSLQQAIDLIGPVFAVISRQSKLPQGITTEQFVIDLVGRQATCPAGYSVPPAFAGAGKIRFRFPDAVCASCALRARCCAGKKGRTLCVGTTYPLLQAARQRQATKAFKTDYHQHRSGVEGCLSSLVRGQGLRVSRYIGHRKRHLQALFSGTAANLKRVAHWLAGERPHRSHRPWALSAEAGP